MENGPHNNLHMWVGGSHAVWPQRLGGNMGQEFSPRDPAFLLHHGNIDRLWSAWLKSGSGTAARSNPSDQSWLDRPFAMPHHTGAGSKVYRVADLLNTNALGYSYDGEFVATASARREGAVLPPAVAVVLSAQPLDISSGSARTRIVASAAAIARADANNAPAAHGKLLLSRLTLPKQTVSFSVYLTSPTLADPSERNLVGYVTLLNPNARSL